VNLFSSFGWRAPDSAVDLDLAYANTDLTGNGAIPVELMAQDRSAVFTFPDTTKNELFSVNLNGEHWFGKQVLISGNLFYRNLDTKSFNGDAGDFGTCAPANETADETEDGMEAAAETGNGEEEGATPVHQEPTYLCDEDEEVLMDRAGNPILAQDADGNPYDAINNRSSRQQETGGGTLQATLLQDLFGLSNQFILGVSYFTGS